MIDGIACVQAMATTEEATRQHSRTESIQALANFIQEETEKQVQRPLLQLKMPSGPPTDFSIALFYAIPCLKMAVLESFYCCGIARISESETSSRSDTWKCRCY
eukprot:1369163-Amphidinium_carterae.2